MGAALAPSFLIERELKSGRLIAPVGFLVFKEGLIVYPPRENPIPGANAGPLSTGWPAMAGWARTVSGAPEHWVRSSRPVPDLKGTD